MSVVPCCISGRINISFSSSRSSFLVLLKQPYGITQCYLPTDKWTLLQDHHRALQARISDPPVIRRWRIGRPRQSWLRTVEALGLATAKWCARLIALVEGLRRLTRQRMSNCCFVSMFVFETKCSMYPVWSFRFFTEFHDLHQVRFCHWSWCTICSACSVFSALSGCSVAGLLSPVSVAQRPQ